VPDDDVDGEEAWERLVDDEPEVRNVEAIRTENEWQVTVWVAEFLRDEPLESELRDSMDEALAAVAGVTEALQEDREVWAVTGTPSGEALAQAAAGVVDGLAERAKAYIDGLGHND
jgi:hypothetical protein